MKKRTIPSKPVFEVKNFGSSDIADLASAKANPSESFNVPFTFAIGEVGNDAADNFELVVCSPDKAVEVMRTETSYVTLPILLPEVVASFVEGLVTYANTRDDPHAFLVAKLAWEFDGYR